MKKVTLFGRQISVLLVIGILMAVFTSAALVTYLSNQTKATISVESPFEVKTAEGSLNSTSTSGVEGITWDGDNSILFDEFGGSTIYFTNYINKKIGIDIDVNDKELIRHVGDNDMQGLDVEFSFFAGRYRRPEGSPARADDYNGDVDYGWDPYTDPIEGTCHGQGNNGPGAADITGTSYVSVKDGICYYSDDAFDFQPINGQLVSNFEYTYPAGFTEEIAQYVATFNIAIEPGTYEYTRQILVQE